MNNQIIQRYFQWIVGERKGEVMVFDKIEPDGAEVFIVFKDGARINENLVAGINQTDLTGKFMAEVDSPQNLWTFKETWVGRIEERWEEQDETNPGNKVCVQPFYPGRRVIKLVAPRPTPKKSSKFGAMVATAPSLPPEEILTQNEKLLEQPKLMNETDPVFILMSKAKKEDNDITMTITISLPNKNLYDLAKQSFDEGDQKFVEYIIQNITVDEIKDALKVAITEMYENPEGTLMV